jgi:ribosomal protein L35
MNFKIKTKKATIKRIKKKKYILCRKKAYKAHFMRRKKSNQLRELSKQVQVHRADKSKVLLMLPYK